MNPRILFVGTNNAFSQHLASRLRQYDIHVTEHIGVNEVVDHVRSTNVGIVLLDMERIKGEGIALIQNIKNTFPCTEIILLTNPEQVALSIAAMKLSPIEEIYLPLDIQTLIKTIIRAQERWEDNNSQLEI